MKRPFGKILPLFSALWLLAACQTPTTYAPTLTADEIRAEEANQQRMVDEIQAQGGTKKKWKNRSDMRKQFERVAERIEEAGADVCRELGLPKLKRSCYYYFDILRNDDLNARADGRSIIVNSGMIRFTENDDELAGILGHELAHNLMAHLDATRNNALAGGVVGLMVDAIAASQGVSTNGDFTRTGMEAGVLSYSIPFEQEADYIGLYIMARAGYNPARAPYLWRRMSLEYPDTIYSAKTHPSNAARFVALQKTIDEIAYKRKHRLPLLPDVKQEVTSSM